MKKLLAVLVFGMTMFSGSTAFAHTVEEGDTMSDIAKENDMSLHALSKLNPQVKDIDLIIVGQEIKTEANVSKTEVREQPEVKQVKAAQASEVAVTQHEKDLMARLVRAEAQGESYQGKVAVAEVIVNRVESDQFPDTVSGVIYQSGQFSPATNGSINRAATEDSKKAVNEALASESSIVGNSLFFYNPQTASSRWLDSKSTKAVIGNHTFK